MPSSSLKSLDASNCSLKTIHGSFFRVGIEIKLNNNNIKELPREETLAFLEQGGKFGRNGLDLEYNDLVYPPQHVFKEGRDAVKAYLKANKNVMVSSKNINILILGDEEKGKTSLGRGFAGKVNSASDITYRTHAFDVYTTVSREEILHIQDPGGQKEYEAMTTLLGGNNGLKAILLNPDDLTTIEKFQKAGWSWVEKILDGFDSPHFTFVISKIDTIKNGDELGAVLAKLKGKLVSYVESQAFELQTTREERLEQLNNELEEIKLDLVENEEDAELDIESKASKSKSLHDKRRATERQIDSQTYKVRHPPNFNLDCVSFVNSMTREGFNEFEDNIHTCIDRLPVIKLQEKWQDVVDWLLTQNEQKPYVTLSDLLGHRRNPDTDTDRDQDTDTNTDKEKHKDTDTDPDTDQDKDKDNEKDKDKDKDADRITETLLVCNIFGILMTQAFQV